MTVRRLGLVVGLSLIGLLVGVSVGIASSISSLNPDRRGETNGFVAPSPRPSPSPSPTVAMPGVLGNSARLLTNGSNVVIAQGDALAYGSTDPRRAGWISLRPPANASGLVIDPNNPQRAITGGNSIRVTGDGSNWVAVPSPLPGAGSYQPLLISPLEPNVWFFFHQNRLLLTRDAGATWTELPPSFPNPVVVTGPVVGQFFVASGNKVSQLTNYGQQIMEKAALPQGTVTELVGVGGSRPVLMARAGTSGVFVLDGSTWTKTGHFTGPIASGASTLLIGNGGTKLGQPGAIEYSRDGGHTWSQSRGLPFDQTVEAVAGQSSSDNFYAYCYGGDLYGSSDGGQTWSLVTKSLRSA